MDLIRDNHVWNVKEVTRMGDEVTAIDLVHMDFNKTLDKFPVENDPRENG